MGWVGNNSWTHPPFFSRHLVPQNVGNIIFVCYFLNIGLESKKNNVLLTSPSNQFRDYSIWNRIEKLVPQHCNFAPQTLKNFATNDQTIFTPWLFAEIWVSKNPGFVAGSPPGGLYFQKWPHNKYFRSFWPTIKKHNCLIKWLPSFLFGPRALHNPKRVM